MSDNRNSQTLTLPILQIYNLIAKALTTKSSLQWNSFVKLEEKTPWYRTIISIFDRKTPVITINYIHIWQEKICDMDQLYQYLTGKLCDIDQQQFLILINNKTFDRKNSVISINNNYLMISINNNKIWQENSVISININNIFDGKNFVKEIYQK